MEFNEISILSINSAITPATYDYLDQNFKGISRSSFIVIKLNTPGGLVSTTKDIITMVGREKRPFAVWITPEGASASSAGAIIASSAHFIFMSRGTNMGAATPVGLNEDIKESDGRNKALNDLTALVRSLSHSRGRPSAPFEKMITSAESYTAQEALDLKIIDGIVSEPKDLLTFLESKEIFINGVTTKLKATNAGIKNYDPTMGQKLLEVLANPQTAYFLFLVGIALIYFEFQAPGGFIAGTIGVCFIILSGIAFQVLPLDWGSMGLIVAGIFLLVMELFVTSYGLLGLAGIAAFVMGSLFLFHGESGYISVEYPVIISTLSGVGFAVAIAVWYMLKEKKKQKPINNFFLPVGAQGVVLTVAASDYQVKVRGEIWKATSDDALAAGDSVTVSEIIAEKLTIKVKKNL